MWGGSYAGFDQWATAKELPPHLATIVPAAAAHPPLDYPSYNNVGETYDMQWFTLTAGRAGQQNLFADQKFWRTQFLDAYKKHIAFKTLDSFVANPSVNFQRILKHPTADTYYDAMVPTREQFQKIRLPILTITGQYDGDELGALTFYRDHLANASPETRAKHFLIIGPWDHAGTRTPTDEVGGVKFGGVSRQMRPLSRPLSKSTAAWMSSGMLHGCSMFSRHENNELEWTLPLLLWRISV